MFIYALAYSRPEVPLVDKIVIRLSSPDPTLGDNPVR